MPLSWTQRLFSAATPMAAACRGHDWAATPLGAPDGWDAPLKTLVPIVLASNQPMFVVWGEARTLLYNDAYADLMGDKHPAGLGRDFLAVWHEIRVDLEPIVAAAYRGDPTQMDDIVLWIERRGFREEAHFSFFYAPVPGESGAVAGFLCACTETTGQVMTERRLALSEARHRGVLANTDEGFTLFDADFTMLEVNEAATRLIGLPREALVGRSHWERFPGTADSDLGRMYRRVLATGRPERLEHAYVFDDGRRCWLEARAFRVGEGMAVLFRDVTEQRETLDALREADARKDEFLAMLAHELRNPLAPVANAARLLRRGADEARSRALGELIDRQVTHLGRLVDDLLDVSRVTRGLATIEHAPVDLREVVAVAIEQTQGAIQARGHTLRTVIAAAPLVVPGDYHRLVQVVANLLDNAAKYTAPGGAIALEASGDDHEARIVVRDDGVGIAEALLPRVFELFTQAERTMDRAQGGLGIGLALVRSLVELHGGRIRAESDGPQRGSAFTVTLPRAGPGQARAEGD